MLSETYTAEEKIAIAKHIKDISPAQLDSDMDKLILVGPNAHRLSERSTVGNNVVDYFTFVPRLATKGKYNVNFYEFLANIDTFREKKFIQNMIAYYAEVKNKNNTKHPHKVLKEVYNICISAINIMRPLNCMEIYTRFQAKRVLNFCAGWGGSAVAAAALNLPAFYGVEINGDLKTPYDNMVSYLRTKSTTEFRIDIADAASYDYSAIDYDTVFSSPPYYAIEKYANNPVYETKAEMDERFYKPVFANSYRGLTKNGHFIINICREVYDNILVPMLGEAHVVFPLKKSKRQNNHIELVYVWVKQH